jgi:hypothetical protein
MSIEEYITQQPEDRRAIMRALHKTIMATDKSVEAAVEPMMGKEMILYKEQCYMKYGLASVKNHLSLHCLPMYMNPKIHEQYEKELPDAKFQKGCINFTSAEAMPDKVVSNLITDCATINIAEVLEKRKKK